MDLTFQSHYVLNRIIYEAVADVGYKGELKRYQEIIEVV